ncbi:MAG TPA: hypothetical protein VI968_00955 [archaeon]|nr:hypothetical protein [archaeon]
MKSIKKKYNFYAGAAVSSWALLIMIVVGEIYAPFKDFLKGTFTHHWIGKVVIVAILFFLVSALEKKRMEEKHAWYSVIAVIALIFLFYIIEFFE